MDVLTTVMLAGAGLLGGIVATVVGGAAIVMYPALIAAGVPPHAATMCNLTALLPASLAATITDRSQLPPFNRAFIGLVVWSISGAAVGAVLLLVTPSRTFEMVVPLLLGFATILFGYAERISLWIRARAERRGRAITFSLTSLRVLLPVSVYGGYFCAGVGILYLGVLSLATAGDYRSANVTKNLVSFLNATVAVAIFVARGEIVWVPTLALMAGTVAGGVLGAWIARIIPKEVVRILIVVCGTALTVSFAWRYWF